MLFSLSSSDKNHSQEIPIPKLSTVLTNEILCTRILFSKYMKASSLARAKIDRIWRASLLSNLEKYKLVHLPEQELHSTLLALYRNKSFGAVPQKGGRENQARADTMQCFSELEQKKASTLTEVFAPNDAPQEDFCETLTGGGASSFFMNFTS